MGGITFLELGLCSGESGDLHACLRGNVRYLSSWGADSVCWEKIQDNFNRTKRLTFTDTIIFQTNCWID